MNKETYSTSSGQAKICQNCNQDFTIEPEDFNFYEKIQVPAPTFCPECRLKRRFAWRNEHTLFKVKDNSSGKEIFAGFPPSSNLKIYDRDYWWSDAWDPMNYGRDYDFFRNFFEQFRDLIYEVPWSSKSVTNVKDSDYCDQAGYLKNCYLCFNGDYVEDSAYCVRCTKVKNSFDLTQSLEDELCYEGVAINGCYRTFFSQDCEGCNDVWFSKNLSGCSNCFGCSDLRSKSYYIFNKPYSKGSYKQKMEELGLDSWASLEKIKEEVSKHLLRFPVKYFHGIRAVNSSGDYLRNTKNARESFSLDDAQDVKYVQFAYLGTKDSYDYSVWGNSASQMYESLTCGEQCDSVKFCFDCWPSCRNLEYSICCHSSSDCFGCVGLKKKQYCIFNRQYSKEEYGLLREKIIQRMDQMPYKDKKGNIYKYGEFFPPEFSPFAYNESMLNDSYPLTKEEAIKAGYSWRDPELKEYEITLSVSAIPDSIKETSDDILKETIQCLVCKRAYRIIPNELSFLRSIGLAVPRLCVNCRLARRLSSINQPLYYRRRCQCFGQKSENGVYQNSVKHFHEAGGCPNEFETSYPPSGKEIVYCEQCYNSEVA